MSDPKLNTDAESAASTDDVTKMMNEMMQKMAACGCGSKMAQMMRKAFSGANSDEYDPECEMGHQPEDMIRQMGTCGCGPMMAKMMGQYFQQQKEQEPRAR